MKNIFAKTVAVLTTAMMTVSVGAMNFSSLAITNAAENALEFVDNTETNEYSIFSWNRNGSEVSVSITNTTRLPRYARVRIYCYNGTLVKTLTDAAVLDDGETLSLSGNVPEATDFSFGASLGTDSTPYSPDLTSWLRT